VCGGCALQHLDPQAQIEAKQDTLLQNLERIGKVSPLRVLEPLRGPLWHYRRKARLSVRYVTKKERLLIGFRERQGRFVAEMSECHVLDQRVAGVLPQLNSLIAALDARDRIPQIEVACGDRLPSSPSWTPRHVDLEALAGFAREHGIAVMLQPQPSQHRSSGTTRNSNSACGIWSHAGVWPADLSVNAK
jgi:23S rRNA (uracil1939-C5)-methyltransferase